MNNVSYSIIIPAYNEELFIAECIKWVNASMESIDMVGEIIVVDNNSTDDTSAIAKTFGANVVFEPVNQISKARNAGARIARGEFYIFLDADTQLTPKLLRKALRSLTKHGWCGGGAHVKLSGFESDLGRKFYMTVVEALQKNHIAAGCFIFCRADSFNEIGGFNEMLFAFEEIWFCHNIIRWGKKNNMPFCLLKDQFIESSSRKFDSPYSFLKLWLLFLVPFFFFSRTLSYFWYKRSDKNTFKLD